MKQFDDLVKRLRGTVYTPLEAYNEIARLRAALEAKDAEIRQLKKQRDDEIAHRQTAEAHLDERLIAAGTVNLRRRIEAVDKDNASLRAALKQASEALARMLLELDFMVERGVISDVRNDIIFDDAHAALTEARKLLGEG